jgi:hypothetical protein
MRISRVMRVTGLVLLVAGGVQCARCVVAILRGGDPYIVLHSCWLLLSASFFLCIGAWLVQRFSRRSRRPIMVTASGEIGPDGRTRPSEAAARVGLTVGLAILAGVVLLFVGFLLFFLLFLSLWKGP